jgi:hypothetical protein
MLVRDSDQMIAVDARVCAATFRRRHYVLRNQVNNMVNSSWRCHSHDTLFSYDLHRQA